MDKNQTEGATSTSAADEATMVTRSIFIHEKSIRKESREADFVASTDIVDMHDEVVAQDWDLRDFKNNPVALFAHCSRDLPIGKCIRCEVVMGPRGAQLECTIKFSTADLNPLAEQVWRNIEEGVLKAVSVGFVPRDLRFEVRDGREVLVLGKNKLLEIIVTPIGANPEALAKMKSKARNSAQPQPPVAVAAGHTETSMTEEEMKAAVAAKDAELAALKAENEDLKAKAADAKAQAEVAKSAVETVVTGTLATEESDLVVAKALADRDAAAEKADAAEKRVAELEAAALVSEVDALVGTKILPAQKDAYVAIAKADRTAFSALVATLPELTATKAVMGEDPVKAADAVGDLGALLLEAGDAADTEADLGALV